VAFDVGDVLDVRLPGGGGGLVELACDDERGRSDLVQSVDDAPAAQRTEDMKLVGAVHGVVHGRLSLHLRDGVDEVLWRRHYTAQDEQIGCPEVGWSVGQVRAVAAADLVVVDDYPPGFFGECGDVAHVVVRHPRAAVQDEQGQGSGPCVVGRGDPYPRFVAAEGHHLGRTSHGDQNGPVKVS
jgi:hypothetical protein